MSRDISKAHPLLVEFWGKVDPWYKAKFPERELILTHVDRSPVEQLLLFVQGRLPAYPGDIVTWKDGFVNKSKHNFLPLSHAIDVGIKVNGKFDWTDATAKTLASAVMDLGYIGRIRWGGAFKDMYHWEVV